MQAAALFKRAWICVLTIKGYAGRDSSVNYSMESKHFLNIQNEIRIEVMSSGKNDVVCNENQKVRESL